MILCFLTLMTWPLPPPHHGTRQPLPAAVNPGHIINCMTLKPLLQRMDHLRTYSICSNILFFVSYSNIPVHGNAPHSLCLNLTPLVCIICLVQLQSKTKCHIFVPDDHVLRASCINQICYIFHISHFRDLLLEFPSQIENILVLFSRNKSKC